MSMEKKACDFTIFGVLGDLSRRKLIPSLYQLDKAGLLDENTRIIGVARHELSQEDFAAKMQNSLETFVKKGLDPKVMKRLLGRLHYVLINLDVPEEYKQLEEVIDQEKRVLVNYFSVAPSLFDDICKGLDHAGIVTPETRVVLEKPIGRDLASSQEINDTVAKVFTENQVYRIDHYLGKETVMNLLALRFANSIFTTNWDHNTIDHVQITVAEEVGIEGRWGYFDESGQTRDMVQNHLMQILTLVAMEPPVNMDGDSIRNEKLKVLKALRPITADTVEEKTVRGQYSAGFIKGQAVPGYLEEQGGNPNSTTESFVALRVDIDNWRWADVPFYLRTGKRLTTKRSEVVIYFKRLPHNIFKDSYKKLPRNKLVIRLQPDEGVEIEMMNKVPGIGKGIKLQKTVLDLSFSDAFSGERVADAYERLILETMIGNQSLFIRRDEVERSWQWIDTIQNAWAQSSEPPKRYPAGTWGPVASVALLARDGREWEE
ncbi:glucose-6-phosphate 1-dehydrogenase [Desulfocapsa sulfexigens DSM 10523]|uniref:Glucose-6-phosphate 1-dehydrogenase n=1 Tax=Desulfocapsa sulfexigens (strain DSM 10523 / SB164P1) TaxID=1167006 RepID=M1P5D7_DESSD|nr:glucose-6-phosphate dehydrogenase [Desulfocapsa sulfexigens]AGF76902.1 glucose-6-phosphate 1-dehydrogenase [Desulfocapsa sulfexigens DSM 10523]